MAVRETGGPGKARAGDEDAKGDGLAADEHFPAFTDAMKRAKPIRLAAWEGMALNLVHSTDKVSGGQTAMCIFGLKNADPDEWRDKTVVEHDISDRVADRLEAARLRMLGELQPKVIEHDESPEPSG